MNETKNSVVLGEVIPATPFGVAQEVSNLKNSPVFLDLVHRVTTFSSQAPSIRVKDDEDEKRATDSLVAISLTLKEAEELRLAIVAMPKKFCSLVDATFKSLKDDLAKARGLIEPRILAYRKQKHLALQREQQRMAKEQARIEKKLEKAGVEVSLPPPPLLKPETVTRGEMGASHAQRRWTFEVTDKMALIRAVAAGEEKPEALEVNNRYIQSMIVAGIRQMPGVRIFQEEKLQIRTRL